MKRREFLQGISATVALAAVPGAALAAGATAGVERTARREVSATLLRRMGCRSDPQGPDQWQLAPWGEPLPAGAKMEGGDLKLWVERPGEFTAGERVAIAGVEWRVLTDDCPAKVVSIFRREFPPLYLQPGDSIRVS